MSKILWIMNKYVGSEKAEEFYPYFLKNTQQELEKKGHQLSFVLFSNLLAECETINNKLVFNAGNYANLTVEELGLEASRIEKEYEFTFKQAYFADIIQTFKGQNNRKITVPEKYFEDLSFLVPRFLFLEQLIKTKNFDVIFSDVSPEVEMEFGRVLGNKLNKIVLKSYEGSALGHSVLLKLLDFGKYKWMDVPSDFEWSNEDAKKYCKEFIQKNLNPYIPYSTLAPRASIINRITANVNLNFIIRLPLVLYRLTMRLPLSLFYLIERSKLKPMIYDNFDPTIPNLFMGFHLNQESTMVLRSQPYTNQISLVEMISRVLPYNYVLYVREHPHWPDRFSYKYLKKIKDFPNVRIISPKISIHKILANTSGVLTYNATTGIEALIYSKPVLSFASNIYYTHHSGVDYCNDLFELGAKLSQLINRKIDNKETISYIYKLKKKSIPFCIGSYSFKSIEDSKSKAIAFSNYLIAAISKV